MGRRQDRGLILWWNRGIKKLSKGDHKPALVESISQNCMKTNTHNEGPLNYLLIWDCLEQVTTLDTSNTNFSAISRLFYHIDFPYLFIEVILYMNKIVHITFPDFCDSYRNKVKKK